MIIFNKKHILSKIEINKNNIYQSIKMIKNPKYNNYHNYRLYNAKKKEYISQSKKPKLKEQTPARFFSLPENHKNSLQCFKHCSQWILNFSSYSPQLKSTIASTSLIGSVNNKNANFSFDSSLPNYDDISEYLPIDIKENQRFALDSDQPKLPLNIEFPILKDNTKTEIEKIGKEFIGYIFEIELNAKLHEQNNRNNYHTVFKDNINFKVKGYDIMKAIYNKLYSFNCENSNYLPTQYNSDEFSLSAIVFNNIQCSFGISFSISANSYASFKKTQHIKTSINSLIYLNIQITKIKITYSLPLIVFTIKKKENALLTTLNSLPDVIPEYYPKKHQNEINNTPKQMIVPYINFSNWHSFMTTTTPIIYESESLLIKDIFNSFHKASLFGMNCLFRLDPQTYTKCNFFPSLNTVYIVTNANESLYSNATTTITTNNDTSSTLDESFINSISSNQDDNNNNNKTHKIIYKEQIKEIYYTSSYSNQIQSLMKEFTELDELTIGDISSESYFSLIWTPMKTPQPQMKGMKFIECENYSSIEVFYKFKNDKIIESAHYMKVIGINEKDIKGRNISSYDNNLFDFFWFANKTPTPNMFNQFLFEQDLLNNKNSFYALKDKLKSLPIV